MPTKAEYESLCGDFQHTNSLINVLCEMIIDVCKWNLDVESPNVPVSLYNLQALIDCMEENGMPLPNKQWFKEDGYRCYGNNYGWGMPFDRKKFYSLFSKDKLFNKPYEEKQVKYVASVEEKLLPLLKKEYGVYEFMTYPCDGVSTGFVIFYRTEEELQKNQETGINDKIEKMILDELRFLGYDKEFPMGKVESLGRERNAVEIEFDSDENVRKNFSGSYYYRLHDGPNREK